jgi:hypothetical protein
MSDTPEVQLADSELERRRLLCVLGETLDKLYRVDRLLKRQRIFLGSVREGEGPVSGVDALVEFLDRHREAFLASADAVAGFLQGGPTNEATRAGILAALNILVSGVLQVHDLLLLIPREAALPQASFVLKDCFGPKYPGASIVLTNFYSAYEYRFEDILKKINIEQEERGRLKQLKQGGNVICQAFADKDNALAWAVLAHEYGHTIDDEERISERIVFGDELPTRGSDPKQDWLVSVVAETVADFIAARVLGPASLMPILFLEMMQPDLKPAGNSAGHPPTPLRVQLVREYLRDFGVVTADFEKDFQTYEYEYKYKVARMGKVEQDKLSALASQAEGVLKKSADEIAAKVNGLGVRGFDKENAENAREKAEVLRETADWGQPISSRRLRSDEKIFKALSSLKSGMTMRDEAYEVFAAFDEKPVPSSEILTAGWLYKMSSFEAKLMEAFPGADRKADLGSYIDYLDATDRRLLKSLELAAVHSELRGRPDSI